VERKRHYAVEKLSPQARALVDAGLGDNKTYQQIVDALKKETGEKLPLSSLQRYHAKRWFPVRAALEETERLHGLVKESLEKSQGKKLDEATSEVSKAMLFKVVTALKDPDPYALYSLVLAEGRLDVQKERNRILRERTANDREKIALLERTVAVREKQIERVKANAEKVKGALAAGVKPEKVAEMVDRLLGLSK